MASEWQTAFVVSHKMSWCALLTAVKNYNKSLEKLQDSKTKIQDQDQDQKFMIQDQDQNFHFLSSWRLETKTLISRTTSLVMS